jgi:hypothetical protein
MGDSKLVDMNGEAFGVAGNPLIVETEGESGSDWQYSKQAEAHTADIDAGAGTVLGKFIKAAVSGSTHKVSGIQLYLTADLSAALTVKLISAADSGSNTIADGATQTILWSGRWDDTAEQGDPIGAVFTKPLTAVENESLFLVFSAACTLDINLQGSTVS